MLYRCFLKQSSPRSYSEFISCRCVYSNVRFNSSIPERSRKLPGTKDRPILVRWQRWILGGLAVGVVASQAWLFYNRQRLQNSFVGYTLVAKETVSSTASIFHLAPTKTSVDYEKYKQAWTQGIWNFHFKQPQIQIVRAYTPLPPRDEDVKNGSQNLRFLIRHDPHGEVSSYLHRLPIGSAIEMRGPNLEYRLTPDIRQVVFFAGGTGIAPALQIAHAMFDANQNPTQESEEIRKSKKLHIFWASRRREDCEGGSSDAPADEAKPIKSSFRGLFGHAKPIVPPLLSGEKGVIVKELEQLKQSYPGQVTVEYFVNAEGTWINEDVVFNSLSRFDDKDFSKGAPSPSEERQIIISGPNGFITHLAGPKEWRNGIEEQGPVSRIMAHAIAQNPHHVKVWKV